MECKHEHLRAVGDRLFCKDCGQELPMELLAAKNGGGNPAPGEKPDKAPAKKKTARKAV